MPTLWSFSLASSVEEPRPSVAELIPEINVYPDTLFTSSATLPSDPESLSIPSPPPNSMRGSRISSNMSSPQSSRPASPTGPAGAGGGSTSNSNLSSAFSSSVALTAPSPFPLGFHGSIEDMRPLQHHHHANPGYYQNHSHTVPEDELGGGITFVGGFGGGSSISSSSIALGGGSTAMAVGRQGLWKNQSVPRRLSALGLDEPRFGWHRDSIAIAKKRMSGRAQGQQAAI
jgi:hypothetical protein